MTFSRNIFIFLIILLSSVNVNNAKAACHTRYMPPSKYTLGVFLANILPYPDCQFGTFFALNDGSEEENKFCIMNTALISMTALITANILACQVFKEVLRVLLGNPFTAPFAPQGAEAAETITFYASFTTSISVALQLLRGTADLHANRVTICKVEKKDVWPAAYPDSHIKELLIKSGEEPTVKNILDKYNKICLYDSMTGNRKWLKFEECWVVDGVHHCAYGPENLDSSIMLCARTGSTCPCAINSDYGMLSKPNYAKDSHGVTKTDRSVKNGVSQNTLIVKDDGTYLKRSPEYYKAHAGRHCRVLRSISKAPITPHYSGIIDDVCNTWAGYSKNSTTLTAGIVQCIVNTMRNLFEKPMPASNIGVTLTDMQNIQYNQYTKDIKVVNDTILSIENMNDNAQADGYSIAQDLLSFNANIVGINDKSLFGDLTGPTYASYVRTMDNKYQSYFELAQAVATQLIIVNDLEDKKNRNAQILSTLKKMIENADAVIAANNATSLISTNIGYIKANNPNIVSYRASIATINTNISSFNTNLQNNLNYCVDVNTGQCSANGQNGSYPTVPANPSNSSTINCLSVCNQYHSQVPTASSYQNDLDSLNTQLQYYQGLLDSLEGANNAYLATINANIQFINLSKPYTAYDTLSLQNIQNNVDEQNNSFFLSKKQYNTYNLTIVNNFLTNNNISTITDSLNSTQITSALNSLCPRYDLLNSFCALDQNNLDNAKIILKQYQDMFTDIPNDFYDNLNNVNNDLSTLLDEIINNQTQFMANALAANSIGYTPFQSLQGGVMAFVLLLFVFFIVYIGYRMITGELSANINDFLPVLIDIAIVYYFAIGGAWKDWLINFVVNAANSLGQLALEVPLNVVGNSDRCQYYQNYYIPDTLKTKCDFPNPSGSIDLQIVTYEPRTGKEVRGCIKGPYLPAPQYEQIYKPVVYGVLNKYGATEKVWLPVYCQSNADSTKFILADISVNQITGDYTMLSCKNGYTMEDGYRVSELRKMGISDDYLSADSSGVVHTAIEIAGVNGAIINIIDAIQNDELRILTANNKYKNKVFIESIRSFVNRIERHYPILHQYGVYRDMSYVAMFDTLDCKIMHYFGYTPDDTGDIMYFKFIIGLVLAFPFGWIVGMLLLVFAVMLLSMLGKLTQSYIVSMSTLMILLFMSPMIIPLKLFPQTKGYFDEWLKKVTGYLANIPISMLIIGLMIVLSDYSIYGPANKYVANNVFNSDGTINTNCANNLNLSTSPLICLAYYFTNHIQWVGIPLSPAIIPVPNVPGEFYGAIFKSLIVAVGIAFAMVSAVDILESVLLSIGGGADTKLSGSMFNSNSGLASKALEGAGSVAKSVASIPGDIASKAKNNRT